METKIPVPGKGIITGLLCLLILASFQKGFSQTLLPLEGHGRVFTLKQILDSIGARNPGLQQFVFKTRASYARGKASKAWMAPTAGAGLSEFPYSSSGKFDNNGGMMPRKMLMLRLQQMFPNFSMQRKEQAYYQSYASQHRDDRETMKNMLFTKAKVAYDDAYIAEKKLTVLAEQEKQLQLLIQIAEGRLAYNQAVLPNIYKARARLSDLRSMRIKLESITGQAAATLNSLMDFPADTPLKVDTTFNFLHEETPILQVDSSYVQIHRSDIHHITDEIHSMNLQQQVASSMAKPVFGITFDNMRMPVNTPSGKGSMYMYNAMAMISIPIAPWFSKGYKSKVQAMDYQIEAMQKMQSNQVQVALGNIRKDWLKLQSAQQDLQIFQTQVIPAYAKTFQANLDAFSENTGNIYETLMAWNDLTMKKMEYFDKLKDLLNIRIMLETEMQQY